MPTNKLNELTVLELKERLRSAGLSVSGLKKALVARLAKHEAASGATGKSSPARARSPAHNAQPVVSVVLVIAQLALGMVWYHESKCAVRYTTFFFPFFLFFFLTVFPLKHFQSRLLFR